MSASSDASLPTQVEAESERKAGNDIVVCGIDVRANRPLAQQIEQNANGPTVGDPPQAGSKSLPHFHPVSRQPGGHAFYETVKRKSITEKQSLHAVFHSSSIRTDEFVG